MPLKHEDRMLVIQALREGIVDADTKQNPWVQVHVNSLRVIAELVQECNEIVAGHEFKLVMKGDYEFQAGMLEHEIHEALVAAGWRPPVTEGQIRHAAGDYSDKLVGQYHERQGVYVGFVEGAKWTPPAKPLSPETAAFGAEYMISKPPQVIHLGSSDDPQCELENREGKK